MQGLGNALAGPVFFDAGPILRSCLQVVKLVGLRQGRSTAIVPSYYRARKRTGYGNCLCRAQLDYDLVDAVDGLDGPAGGDCVSESPQGKHEVPDAPGVFTRGCVLVRSVGVRAMPPTQVTPEPVTPERGTPAQWTLLTLICEYDSVTAAAST